MTGHNQSWPGPVVYFPIVLKISMYFQQVSFVDVLSELLDGVEGEAKAFK